MKKALLKKIPVVEAGIKDKQYMELCRQNYLLKVQKATVEHKRTLILNLYDAEDIVNVNIKMLKKWKIKMYIFQLFFLGLCFQKGSLFPKTI